MSCPYSVTKTALFGLTKVLAQELATDNIRVNCIAPGVIKTNLSKGVSDHEEVLQSFIFSPMYLTLICRYGEIKWL